MAKRPTPNPLEGLPAAVITHTIARIHGEQTGDLTVYHAGTPSARIALTWGGLLMTFWSAEAAQSVLEGFAAARPMLAHLVRELPPAGPTGEPFAQQTLALDWKRRASYAVVARDGLTADKRRVMRWLDIGPVTWQLLDQAGYKSALDLLRRAHSTATHVFPDGRKHRGDPTRDDYTPPQ